MSAPEHETTFSSAATEILTSRGIDPEDAPGLGITEITEATELPDELTHHPYVTVPGLLLRWDPVPVPGTDGVPEPGWQYRPHAPTETTNAVTGLTETHKYVWPTDGHVALGLTRRGIRADGPVLIVEGSFQSRAVAHYAEDDVTVLAIAGCDAWSRDGLADAGLAVVDGRDVTVVLDADAGTNRNVYDAGVALGTACEGYGAASVSFSRLPVRGTNGVDDLIGRAPTAEARRMLVARIPEMARAKPADRMPKPRKAERIENPGSGDLIKPNDTALATTWADDARSRWRFLLDTGRWLRYRIGRWAPVHDRAPYDDVSRFLAEVADRYHALAVAGGDDDLDDTAAMLLSHAKATAVLARASGYSEVHVERDELDAHPRLWAAGNGVIDLMSGEFTGHDPDLLLTSGSDVIYDPEATCPRFDAFLAEILPDADVRDYVLRLFGVAMFGEVRAGAHVFAVFVGEGRNGKGALIRIMQRLFGSAAVTIEPKALQQRMKEEHLEEVAKLAGKRLATAEEPEEGKGWNTGRIKSWTGGDRLTGRFMRQDSFDFIPSHTLVVTANHRPSVSRSDSAFWMRYREIPFTVTVEGREDPTLEPHITDHELPGVLNRVLQGRADYLAHGLAEPSAVLAAVHEAQAEADHLATFAETHLVVTHDEVDRLPAAEVYERCRKWWSQNVTGERVPSDRGPNNFTRQLQRVLGFEVGGDNPRKTGKAKDSRLTWEGVRWLGEDNPSGLPISGLPNSADQPDDPADDPDSPPWDVDPDGSGLPNSTTSSAESQSNTADPGTAGQSLGSAESAESADLFTGSSTGEKHTPQNQGKPDITVTGMTCVSGPQVIDVRNRQTRQTAPLPEPTRAAVTVDLETGDAGLGYTHPDPRAFVRIAGVREAGTTVVHTGPDAAAEAVLSSQRVVTHNGLAFDLPVLGRADERVDVLALARAGRLHDTMVTESVLHPVLNEAGRPGEIDRAMKHFKLNACAERRGIPGKVDEIDRLAKLHGGYDAIPVDDPEYRAYCAGDVDTTAALARAQLADMARLDATHRAYVAREHRVHAIAAVMGRTGLAVDQALLQRRFWATLGRKGDLSRELIARYDLPTTKADGKPAESPAATKGGKAAILRALHSLGVAMADIPRTPKNAPSFGGDAMREVAARYAEHPNATAIADLCEVVADVAGVRTVYGTALEHLHGDGRVHPEVATFQASGRWSVRKPGLTVFGKRGGKVVERAVFTATDPTTALFAIDLSQIDARSIAVHSQDHAYLELFEPDRDAHEIMARLVWGDGSYDADPKTLRERVKAVTHGLPYGLGLTKLVATTGVPEDDAQRVIDTRRERFPRMIEWEAEIRATGEHTGWLDNGFGRMLRVDQRRAYTQSVALMGQSTARDLMMECLLRLPDDIAAMLVAQVHDEAVFEVPRAQAAEIVEIIRAAFNFEWAPPGASRPVRIEAEPGRLAHRWSGCYGAQYDRAEV